VPQLSPEEVERYDNRREAARARLAAQTGMSAEQSTRLGELLEKMGKDVNATYSRLISPTVERGGTPSPPEVQEYTEVTGTAIMEAYDAILALVPGGKEALRAAHFSLSAQLDMVALQRSWYLASLPKDRTK
jgi:hypothetical protein